MYHYSFNFTENLQISIFKFGQFPKERTQFFAQFLIPGKFVAFKTNLNYICVLLVLDKFTVPPPPT